MTAPQSEYGADIGPAAVLSRHPRTRLLNLDGFLTSAATYDVQERP